MILNNACMPVCKTKEACGARWCGYCTILDNTDFKNNKCSFRKAKFKNFIDRIIEMKKKGFSDDEIMGEVGITYSLFKQVIEMAKEKGYITDYPKNVMPKASIDTLMEIRKMLDKGYSYKEIEEKTGYKEKTIANWRYQGRI